MKKLAILVALCVIMCLVVVSCGDTEPNSGDGSTTSSSVSGSSSATSSSSDGNTDKDEGNGGTTDESGTQSGADSVNSSATTDESNSDNGKEDTEEKPVEEPVYTRDGNTIYFGKYPQAKVNDSSITNELNTMAGTLPTTNEPGSWTDYGYYVSKQNSGNMWYVDLNFKGEAYRGVYFVKYRPFDPEKDGSTGNVYQDDNGFMLNNVYWFKYEPISWSILTEENGEALILCDMIIDSQSFNYKNGNFYNDYESSTIRAWLNDNFYNTAFNDLQKELILTTTVDNSSASTAYNNNKHACDNTNDKIFLLSYMEAKTLFKNDAERLKKATDYAKSQGIDASKYADSLNNAKWWLRSPYNGHSKRVNYITAYGNIQSDDYSSFAYYTNYGIVPALRIQLVLEAE